MSRAKIVRIELGQSDSISMRDIERVAQTLGARADLRLNWNGEARDRLLDGEHARLVDAAAALLGGEGLGGRDRGDILDPGRARLD